MADRPLYHTGSIVSITGHHMQVKILQVTACSSCSARRLCPSSESKEKLIDIVEDHTEDYTIGQEVTIYGTTGMKRKAVMLAFGAPLLITLIWIPLAVAWLHLKDITAVGLMLLIYAAYFLLLYQRRDSMGKNFTFKIAKH